MSAITHPQEQGVLVYCETLRQEFAARGGNAVRALDQVTLEVRRGETLAVVGESGCGKSTLARAVMLLRKPTSGHVVFDGRRMDKVRGRDLVRERQRMQMVFQDPNDSLDPRYTVRRSVMEPLLAAGMPRPQAAREAAAVLADVGISSEMLAKYPHEFSGGQRQRIAIARALAARPEFMVLDEPTSALDVSVQAQILNLLKRLQAERGLTYLFVSHNMGVVRHLADRVAVMYLGRIVEIGPADDIFNNPQHPYTRALLSAVPDPDGSSRKRIVLEGDLPSPRKRYNGCAFADRCWLATPECREEQPLLTDHTETAGGQLVACHHANLVHLDPVHGSSAPSAALS